VSGEAAVCLNPHNFYFLLKNIVQIQFQSYKFKEETALETFTNYLPELYDLSVNFFKSHSSFIKTDEFTDGRGHLLFLIL
jgi:hypothetical protein